MRIVLALAALSVGVSAQPRVGVARQPVGVARQQNFGARQGPIVAAPRQVARPVVSAPRQVRVSAPAAPVRLAAGRGDDWTAWNEVYRSSVAESDLTESQHPQHLRPQVWFTNVGAPSNLPGLVAGGDIVSGKNYINYGLAMAAGGHQVRADLSRDMQSRVDDNQSYEYKILDNEIAKDEALRFNHVLSLLSSGNGVTGPTANTGFGGVYNNPLNGFALNTFMGYNEHLATEYDRLNAVNMLRKAEKTGDRNQVARALDYYKGQDAKAISTSLKHLGRAPGAGTGASTQMKKLAPWMMLQGIAYDVKISENDLILAEDNYARNSNADTERELQMAQLVHDGDNMFFQAQMLDNFYSAAAPKGNLATGNTDFANAVNMMNYLGGDMQTQAVELAEEAAAQDYYNKYGVWPFHDMDYGGN